MLTKASFDNFKALKRVDIDLTPFTVIVGKNGSGKTSVLQGIHDVCQLPVRKTELFTRAHDPRRLASRPRKGSMRIALTDAESCTLSVEAQFAADDDERDEFHLMVGLTDNDPPKLEMSDDDVIPSDVGDAHRVDANRVQLDKLLRKARRRFASAVFLRLDAKIMARGSVPVSEEPRLAQDGEGLASVLSYMAGAAPDVLEEIRRDLSAIVPQVRGIRTFPTPIQRRQRERVTIGDQAVYRTFDEEVMGHRFSLDMGAGRLIEADLLSEGTVLALGLLTALRHPQCPRLVLLDDIDGALHTAAQVELVRALRSILASRPGVQVVCTSHSPDLLDQVMLEEVRVMALDKDGYAKCSRLSDHPESEQWRKMLRTGEFWASVGEDWLLEDSDDAR